MSSRRQSIRISKTSTVTVSKSSSCDIVTSTPLSPNRKRTHDIFSLELEPLSAMSMSSPQWISGSDILFKTPNTTVLSRRSTMHHQQRKRGNDIDFKIPSLMFISPPGVKTRTRRSSIYVSTTTTQKKASPKGKSQKKEQATMKRAGKTSQGKKRQTQITAEKVSLTDMSLVSSPLAKIKKGGKGQLSSKGKSPSHKSSTAKSSSSAKKSKSKGSSVDISGRSSPKKSSPIALRKRGNRSVASSPSKLVKNKKNEMTIIKEKILTETGIQSPKRKETSSPIRKVKSPTVKLLSAKKAKSSRRTSGKKDISTPSSSSDTDIKSPTSLVKNKKTLKSSKTNTPSVELKSESQTLKLKQNASPSATESSPRKNKPKSPQQQNKKRSTSTSISKADVSKETPKKSPKSTTTKRSTSRRASNRRVKTVQQNSQDISLETPVKKRKSLSPKSRKTGSTKKSLKLKNRVEEGPLSPQQNQELLSDVMQKSPDTKARRSSSSKRVKKNASSLQQVQKSPSKLNKRTSTSISKADVSKETPKKSPTSTTTKRSTSRRASNRRVKTVLQNSQDISLETPVKKRKSLSPKSRKTGSTKKSFKLKNRVEEGPFSPQQNQELLSDVMQKSTDTKTRRSSSSKRVKKSASSPQQVQKSPKKSPKKTPIVKSPPAKKGVSAKTTPSRRERIRIQSSQEKQSSLTRRTSKQTPAALSPSIKKARVILKKTPDHTLFVESRSSRTVNILGTLNATDVKQSPVRNLSATRTKNHKLGSHFHHESSYDTTPRASSSSLRTSSSSVVAKKIISAATESPRISSRVSLSASKTSKRLIPLEKPTSSGDWGKSRASSSSSTERKDKVDDEYTWNSFSHSPLKRRKLEIESEEIDRVVDTMFKSSSLVRRRDSPSLCTKLLKGSPARSTIMKELEADSVPMTSLTLSGRKSLRGNVARNITPSVAAPKARKILGVFDSSSTLRNKETLQSYNINQRAESSAVFLEQYDSDSGRTEQISKKYNLINDDEGEEIESNDHVLPISSPENEMEEESLVQQDRDTTDTDSETEEDDIDDRNVSISQTSRSQRCVIS